MLRKNVQILEARQKDGYLCVCLCVMYVFLYAFRSGHARELVSDPAI